MSRVGCGAGCCRPSSAESRHSRPRPSRSRWCCDRHRSRRWRSRAPGRPRPRPRHRRRRSRRPSPRRASASTARRCSTALTSPRISELLRPCSATPRSTCSRSRGCSRAGSDAPGLPASIGFGSARCHSTRCPTRSSAGCGPR
ncbi:hypothetical protein FJ656_12765 [Schumannella luteola]|nr:hypothetical protein FJ656_12765 [Schumannella luteola]